MTTLLSEVQTSATTEMSPFARTIYEQKYAWKDDEGNVVEQWDGTAWRVATNVMAALGYEHGSNETQKIYGYIRDRKFMPGGRYLYASGRGLHQVQNCLLMKCGDSREGWSRLLHDASMALMTGAGIGIDYSDVREAGAPIKRTGGVASGPISVMQMINEAGRHIMQGGSRRSAIWAGLKWSHPDCLTFIRSKDWSQDLRDLKAKDFNFPAPLDMTNISVILDDHFFEAMEDENHLDHDKAKTIYWATLKRMVKTAEPGFSIDIKENAGETLRNACTEVTSADDSDICNLGSINLARVETLAEMEDLVEAAALFLLAGTVYSHVPYDKVKETREKNRRLGLGVMGIHEWLLKRGLRYEPSVELAKWLEVYATSTEVAGRLAAAHGLTAPIKTRAIAPTGTIGIVAETTTGIEPIFCVAYKRRYLVGSNKWKYQYVIDPTAKRLIEDYGVDPDQIEDAYSLAYDVERRVAMQAFVQRYVDHGISSTINLPYVVEDEREVKEFGEMIYRYLPNLRGVTCYPDGARGGQPLTNVPYDVASGKEGVVFEESEERCVGGACGI